ncbi:hypothetical protein JTE90_025806 [Oedothorax gibbosus]|uniref:Transposable element P transposase-like RNase H domain-containing protein n=1 Tax=Oedothorax gibbosus TaxID=931172 RepID=A0AAV6TS25_9ARAC|nr:hypothetical protein JTE90_025806 [Oedothorax gibbosus]
MYNFTISKVRNDFLQLLMDTAKEVEDDIKEEGADIASNYGGQEDINPHIFKSVTSKSLSRNELVAQCVIFFIAGYDTTASTLSLASYFLALNPDVQEKVRTEVDEALKESDGELTYVKSMKYLDNIISETLRLYPPIHRLERSADTDYKLKNTEITLRKGMLVSVPIYGMHRDPNFYPDPEKFDPDRFTPEEKAKRDPYRERVANMFGMDILTGPLATTFLIGFTTVILLYWYSIKSFDYWKKYNIPYVKPLPFLGNSLDLFKKSTDFIENRKRRCLKKDAVPTVFVGYPSYKIPSQKKDRRLLKRKIDETDCSIISSKQIKVAATSDCQNLNASYDCQNSNLLVLAQACSEAKQIDIGKDGKDEILKSQGTLTKIQGSIYLKQFAEIRRLRKLLTKRNKKIESLQRKLEQNAKKIEYFEKDVIAQNVEKMRVLNDEGYASRQIEFTLSQISNFGKKNPRWPDSVVRECVLLHAASPKGYDAIQNRKLLLLPSTRTLQRFTGPVNGQVGFTQLIKARVIDEAQKLKPEEKFASLVVDEMAIKPQCIYDSKLDCFFGAKSESIKTAREEYDNANRLLCFILYGLSTKYCIPCGYYFTKQLTAKELYAYTSSIIKDVEECSVRVVTDNLAVNTAMFKVPFPWPCPSATARSRSSSAQKMTFLIY